MRSVVALLMLVLGACLFPAHALDPDKALRHYVRNNWSIQQGLPQISVISVTQDRAGYIWVGTQAGLARFDGVRFTTYTPETDPDVPGIWVRALMPARDGRLWIGTYKGVAVHDGRVFKRVEAVDLSRFPVIDVAALAQGPDGTIWVASNVGLFRVQNDRLVAVAASPTPLVSLMLRRDGVWVGGRGGVHRFDGARWQSMPLPATLADATVHRLLESQGEIWAATSRGLLTRRAAEWVVFADAAGLLNTPVEMLYADRDDNLWAGGDAGIARIRNARLAEFVGSDDAGAIPLARVAFEDRERNLWIGSQLEGLTRLYNGWTRRYTKAEGLTDGIVWSVAPDPDGRRLWVGGNDGVSLLLDGSFQKVVPAADLPHPHGYNLLAERDRLWIGTRGGLRVLDHGDGARARAMPELAPIGGAQINALVRAPDGTLWIGTPDGLYALRGSTLRRYGKSNGLAEERVRFVYRTPAGRFLVGTQNGLYERNGERFSQIGLDVGLPAGLDVTAIREMRDGTLVIGTLAEQVHVFNGRRWQSVTEAQGMPKNSPFFMAEKDGFLWVAGIRGISRVPVSDLKALLAGRGRTVRGEMLLNERGDAMAGQQGYCCNGAGTSKGALVGHMLWLPSRDGVVTMDTRGITKNAVAPRLRIERVRVGGAWRDAAGLAGTELPANHRDLTFDFTVLSFQDPKSAGLQYQLTGYDDGWVTPEQGARSVRYTNLPPGDYSFVVRGSNNDGVWSAANARLRFSIKSKFHETVLFYALFALLLATVVYAGYRLQQHRYRRRQMELESLIQQRTEALEIANHRLEEASQTDPLTGLRNRRYMANQIPQDLAFYDRQMQQGKHQDEVMMFALVDIDHFKSVNDTHGHKAGDRVLQQFAHVLGGLVRSGDYVVRWGGEEFLLVFRPMPTRNLHVIGERVRSAVATHEFDIGSGKPLRLTCSAGLSEYPMFRDHRVQLGWETMVELADQALYYVKSHGRDGWAAFRPTGTTDLLTLLQDLQNGPDALIDTGRLQLLGTKAGVSAPSSQSSERPTPVDGASSP